MARASIIVGQIEELITRTMRWVGDAEMAISDDNGMRAELRTANERLHEAERALAAGRISANGVLKWTAAVVADLEIGLREATVRKRIAVAEAIDPFARIAGTADQQKGRLEELEAERRRIREREPRLTHGTIVTLA